MKVVVFVGYSDSGKTTAITTVARALKRRGRKVATIKHVHHRDFSIDTPGKDTWLHAAAGSSIVVALAPKELAIIWKMDTTTMKLDSIIGMLKKEGVEYILVEGLYRKLSTRRDVIRVLCSTTKQQALTILKSMHPKPIFIAGKLARGRTGESFCDIPLIDFPTDTSIFLRLIG